MRKCRRKNDDWFYAGGTGASVIGQFIQQGSNIVFGSISQSQQAELARQAASRQLSREQASLENQIKLAEQEARNQSLLNRMVESRKQEEYKTIQNIALVFGVFLVIGVGIYYVARR